jgi:hypothetical protein
MPQTCDSRENDFVERLRCAECGNVLSLAVRRVPMPEPLPGEGLLDVGVLTPALLDPHTYALRAPRPGRGDEIVLAPGDVRGTRFIHELVIDTCPCCSTGMYPCVACDECGASVAYRFNDDRRPQTTCFIVDAVKWEPCGEDPDPAELLDPFALGARWDEQSSSGTALVATRWRAQGLKSEIYRDDPPA